MDSINIDEFEVEQFQLLGRFLASVGFSRFVNASGFKFLFAESIHYDHGRKLLWADLHGRACCLGMLECHEEPYLFYINIVGDRFFFNNIHQEETPEGRIARSEMIEYYGKGVVK